MPKSSDSKQSQIHTGHRKRLKQRFLEEGLDGFTDVQVLELLLFYANPRQDTNPIAHELIERFETLANVLDAPASELEKIDGIKANASTLLNFSAQLARRYAVSRTKMGKILDNVENCSEVLIPKFLGRRDEVVYLLCMDSKCQYLGCPEVSEGNVTSALISTRKIVETALAYNAVSVMLAHNHPGGLAIPSTDDVVTTRRVAMALDSVGIRLLDHLVVADNECVSLRESNLYRYEECRATL